MHDNGATRRTFIRGIAASGASTAAAAVALDRADIVDLFAENAEAQAASTAFSDFAALAPSRADALQVPAGYRADVVVKAGDSFANTDGQSFKWGYNNDFLAFFPLDGKADDGLLFANFEYPDPFFVHGNPSNTTKTAAQVKLEQDAVGNAIVHIRRGADDVWKVVSPSPFNRRITGAAPVMPFTGPLAGNPAFPGVGTTVAGSLANCSGGITPWGTALSCEENYDYFLDYAWTPATAGTNDYLNGDGSNAATQPAKYGWVVEHDPYDPSDTGRKHTALGRFRHENTAFRHVAGKPFVLYMGDDKADEGIYKFVSTREYKPFQRAHNLKILTEGTLYIARFAPGGQRTFANVGDTVPTSPTSGTGTWVKIETAELVDTSKTLRARFGADFNKFFATNRPEDVEVHSDGTVYVALTNNSNVKDSHGSVRRMTEAGNDPTALSFAWTDYAAGGPRGGSDPGRQGFSSPDTLVFDSQDNLWVVTDISSSRLNKDNEYKYHANNAAFMVPTKGANAGVAFRFANAPVEAELTGPYFTPDERTLFLSVQHPGEETRASGGVVGNPSTFTSYWPLGNKTANQNPGAPLPSLVAITKVKPKAPDPGSPIVPPPPPGDASKPRVGLLFAAAQPLRRLRGDGVRLQVSLDEAATLTIKLLGRPKGSAKQRTLATKTLKGKKGKQTFLLRPSAATRLLLRRQSSIATTLEITAKDAAGNSTKRTKKLNFRA